MEAYSHFENMNHPIENGTYQESRQKLCSECNNPILTAEDAVMSGEFSYRHRTCPLTKVLWLKDYLAPGGKYPYSQLTEDMERLIREGFKVNVLSVPGFHMASGHPDLVKFNTPFWDNQGYWYKTAKDCINRENGFSE